MATTRQIKQNRALATRPFYAAVGVTDRAVELARTAAGDVQGRVAKVDLQPQALTKAAQDAQARLAARVADLEKGARELPGRVDALVNAYLAELNQTVDTINQRYVDLAVRGNQLVARIRRQQATQDAVAEAQKTVTKAKTTRTQAAKAASTARSSAKATRTSARKTAAAATKAAGDAAAKTGD
jgi:predicted transcriptional regulator